MKIQTMRIGLRDMHFYAYHGVLPQERIVGNHFIAQLSLWANVERAMYTDELEGTISYAEAYDLLCQEIAQPSQLLEHVVWRCVERLFAAFPQLERVEMTLEKHQPPLSGQVEASSFTLTADRD